jgi:hypothetical protein
MGVGAAGWRLSTSKKWKYRLSLRPPPLMVRTDDSDVDIATAVWAVDRLDDDEDGSPVAAVAMRSDPEG